MTAIIEKALYFCLIDPFQSNTIDALVKMNNRVEYETLWRFPIKEQLTAAVGDQNNFFQSGRFKIFEDLEKIR